MSGLLDGRVLVRPDHARSFEIVILAVTGLLLAFALPLLSAPGAVAASAAKVAGLIGTYLWLYLGYGLVLPLASALVMAAAALALNIS